MIKIDGSFGEGGGQILRTSLSLSMMTNQPIHIENIRLKRAKPGIRPQHLTSIMAAKAICNATVEGAHINSTDLFFFPMEIKPGRYKFDVKTAGATGLVLQTIYLPLATRSGKTSFITIKGGTHVPWSPCFHYLEQQWLPFMERIGFRSKLTLHQAGFYPEGGGIIQANIRSSAEITPLQITERGQLVFIRGISATANLDKNIGRRQKHQALRQLESQCKDTKIKHLELPSQSKGTLLLLCAKFEQAQCCYFSLGKKGKRAEQVADEAVNELEQCLQSNGVIDQYLADQLLLPLSFAKGASTFYTPQITKHLLTNAEVIQHFLPTKISIQGQENQPGLVTVTP